ncbi:MAG: 3-oxoacyl-ACP synthase, partial [Muribaculaceae bacterium]|nr:3-oxoacyl-ACP synthase [Muribaculaceae bacterium]
MEFEELRRVVVSPEGVFIDGEKRETGNLKELYRSVSGDYPKFFKMDMLCRLGFIAAEYLLKGYDEREKENFSVVLFNREGSLLTDRNYTETIKERDNYYPSPALFVYTLANIVTGEICIRHKIYGESSFYISDSPDYKKMRKTAENVYLTSDPSAVVYGWTDFIDEENYLADLR